MVTTSPSDAWSEGSIPGQGVKIPHTSWAWNRSNIAANSIKTNGLKPEIKYLALAGNLVGAQVHCKIIVLCLELFPESTPLSWPYR